MSEDEDHDSYMADEVARLERELKDAQDAVHDLRSDLTEREEDVARMRMEAAHADEKIEALEAREHLTEFAAAIQTAHEYAHHSGHWESCPNRVCSSLEKWMLRARKDGAT